MNESIFSFLDSLAKNVSPKKSKTIDDVDNPIYLQPIDNKNQNPFIFNNNNNATTTTNPNQHRSVKPRPSATSIGSTASSTCGLVEKGGANENMYTLVEGPINNHYTHHQDNDYAVLCEEENHYEVSKQRPADLNAADNIYAGINPVFSSQEDSYSCLNQQTPAGNQYEVSTQRQTNPNATDNIYAGINPVFSNNQEGSYAPLNLPENVQQNPIYTKTSKELQGEQPYAALSQRPQQSQDIYTGLDNSKTNQHAPLVSRDTADSNAIYSELEKDDSDDSTREQPKSLESLYDNPIDVTTPCD